MQMGHFAKKNRKILRFGLTEGPGLITRGHGSALARMGQGEIRPIFKEGGGGRRGGGTGVGAPKKIMEGGVVEMETTKSSLGGRLGVRWITGVVKRAF